MDKLTVYQTTIERAIIAYFNLDYDKWGYEYDIKFEVTENPAEGMGNVLAHVYPMLGSE